MLALIVGIFAGCGQAPESGSDPASASASESEPAPVSMPEPVAEEDRSLFAVYRVSDGFEVKLGDAQADIAPILGPTERHVVEYVDEDAPDIKTADVILERWQYKENPEIYIDYDLMNDAKVSGIRCITDEWTLANGLGVGVTHEEVLAKYEEGTVHQYKEDQDLWITYDENGNQIPFTEEGPIYVRFDFTQNEFCDMLVVLDYRPLENIY